MMIRLFLLCVVAFLFAANTQNTTEKNLAPAAVSQPAIQTTSTDLQAVHVDAATGDNAATICTKSIIFEKSNDGSSTNANL